MLLLEWVHPANGLRTALCDAQFLLIGALVKLIGIKAVLIIGTMGYARKLSTLRSLHVYLTSLSNSQPMLPVSTPTTASGQNGSSSSAQHCAG